MTSVHRLIEKVGEVGAIGVVVDVGAHVGTDSLPIARDFPSVRVFAVEPTPSLAQSLRESGRNLPNYTVIEAAIDASEEERVFNLVGKGMAGFNSLNEFMPGVEGLPPVTEQIRVSTKRLDSICDEYGIGKVDILHIDAQGSDLEVLESLGDRLEGVKAGVIEVSNQTRLYVSSVHRDEARAFLESRSFLVFDVQPVDSRSIEQNLFFVNRSVERGLLPRAVPGCSTELLCCGVVSSLCLPAAERGPNVCGGGSRCERGCAECGPHQEPDFLGRPRRFRHVARQASGDGLAGSWLPRARHRFLRNVSR